MISRFPSVTELLAYFVRFLHISFDFYALYRYLKLPSILFVQLDKFDMSLDGDQYHGLLDILDCVSRQSVMHQYQACDRPPAAVRSAPAQWWAYAIR